MTAGGYHPADDPIVWGDTMGDKYYVTDTSLSARFPIYTRANVGEVFPDPVTPLTSSTGECM